VRSIYLQGILITDRTRWPAFAVKSGLADEVLAALDGLVAQLGREDKVDLALAYARGIPWISQVVLGAETEEQVRDNVRACATPALTAVEIATVDDAVAKLDIPEQLLTPGDWDGAVGFSNGQAPPPKL
jgi:aryl-alcohol dehydrogenase-like predicted oxidoreductase